MKELFTQSMDITKYWSKEFMAKKIVATIECVINKKMKPISMKWCNEEVTSNQEYLAL